jgi:hypothetical protein
MWRCSLAVNQNGFNSRITSEALEERFRQVFPAQAGAELIQDLYASGVIVPTIDFTSIAEGSFLPETLQQAWDFATGHTMTNNTTNTLITTPGFWLIDLVVTLSGSGTNPRLASVDLSDGVTSKTIYEIEVTTLASAPYYVNQEKFVVFLRAGDSLTATSQPNGYLSTTYRQIASVNGTFVNPLGFTF